MDIVTKAMEWVLTLAEAMGTRFIPKAPPILDMYFNNIQTTYAEVGYLYHLVIVLY